MKKLVLALFLAMTFALPSGVVMASAAAPAPTGDVKLNATYKAPATGAAEGAKYGDPNGGTVNVIYPTELVGGPMFSLTAYIADAADADRGTMDDVTWLGQANSPGELTAIKSFPVGNRPAIAIGKYVQVWYNNEFLGADKFAASPLYPFFKYFENPPVAENYLHLPQSAATGFPINFKATLVNDAERVKVYANEELVGDYLVSSAKDSTPAIPYADAENTLVKVGIVDNSVTGIRTWSAWLAPKTGEFAIDTGYSFRVELIDMNGDAIAPAPAAANGSFRIPNLPNYKFDSEGYMIGFLTPGQYVSYYNVGVPWQLPIENTGGFELTPDNTKAVYGDTANFFKAELAAPIAPGARGLMNISFKEDFTPPAGIYSGDVQFKMTTSNGDIVGDQKFNVKVVISDTYDLQWNFNGGTYSGSTLPTEFNLATSNLITGTDAITKAGRVFQGWYVDDTDQRAGIEKIDFQKLDPLVMKDITLFAKWSDAAPVPDDKPALPPATTGNLKLDAASLAPKVGNGILTIVNTITGAPVQGWGPSDLNVTSSNAAVLKINYDETIGQFRYTALKAGTAVVQIKIGTTLVNAQIVTVK